MKNRLRLLVSPLLILASLALSGCDGDLRSDTNLQAVQTTFKTSRVVKYGSHAYGRYILLKEGVVFVVTTDGDMNEPKITSVVVLLEP